MCFEKVLPEDEGISTLAIKNFLNNIEREEIELHSYMILRHSKLIDEGYFYPYIKEIEHMMYSVSKTFVVIAIGFLIEEGKITLEDRVIDFFTDLDIVNNSKLEELKIHHLLSMSAGIKEEPSFRFTEHWIKAYFETEFNKVPGEEFKYINLNTYILSVIVCKVSEESLVDYLYQRLFKKLEIKKPKWDLSPEGYEVGGWGLYLKTEDLAKVADVLLHDGCFKEEQVIPLSWIKAMFSLYSDTKNHSNQGKDYICGYGYGVWRCNDMVSYRLDGMYGQFAFLFKELDVVIVTTASTYHSQKIMDLIFQDLVPYFIDETLSFHSTYYRQLMNLNKELSLLNKKSTIRSPYEAKIRNFTYKFRSRSIGFIPFIIQGLKGSLSSGPSSFSIDFNNEVVTILWNEYNQTIDLSASLKNDVIYHTITIDENDYKIACQAYFEKRNVLVLMVYFLSYPHSRKITFSFITRKHCVVSFKECPNIQEPIGSVASSIIGLTNKKTNQIVLETLYSLIDRSAMAKKVKTEE